MKTAENIPAVTVGQLVDTLSESYSTIINRKLPVANMPSVMLWGPPGVGKSQAVRQIATRMEAATGKSIHVTDVRLLLFNPIDLRGIPTANADKTLAVWLRPQIFQMDAAEDVVNILFLDELSAAPQSVQAAAYQIVLDRTVGEHRLPENCIVIAAGNRVTDRSVAYKMPKALANRLLHLEITDSFDSWYKWAVENGVHKLVLGFLNFSRDNLMDFDAASEDLAYATPRSWEMVSNLLNSLGEDPEKLFPLIAGLVGTGNAVEFESWAKVCGSLPDIAAIFAGRENSVPVRTDALYALTSAMTAYARDHAEDHAAIANSIRYAGKLPPDFAAMLLKSYLYLKPDYRETLLQIPEYAAWVKKRGRLLNAAI